jgi:hypothetical protein
MRRHVALSVIVAIGGCARTPPDRPAPTPAPAAVKTDCDEKTPATHQLVEVRGTKELLMKLLKLGLLEGTPDHGGHRENGDQWITGGSVTDEGVARLRAEGCTDAAGCTITIVETKEDYAKRIDELYCPSEAGAP